MNFHARLAILAKLSFSPYLPTFMGSLIALCFAFLANVAKLASIANFYGPPYCFVLCPVGNCGNIVIFAISAKFASIANFYGAPSLLCALPCWRFWQNCHFCRICQICQYRQLLWGPLIALCFAMLAILAKLSFLPVSPTFMGPLIALCFALLAIVILAIFAKFAIMFSFLPFLLLRAFLDISRNPPRSCVSMASENLQPKFLTIFGLFSITVTRKFLTCHVIDFVLLHNQRVTFRSD